MKELLNIPDLESSVEGSETETEADESESD